MRTCIYFILLLAILISGCVASFTAVVPSTILVGDLKVMPSIAWNAAPASMRPYSRRDAQTWTQDGLLLDRIMIIPAVADGETLFISRDDTAALPTFSSDMLPNELEELLESSLVTFFGEGNAVVNTSGLRPHRFGENLGVLFDLDASLTDSPDYRGVAGAFIANDLLYLMLYVAAEPYYYGKHLDEAMSIIETASL